MEFDLIKRIQAACQTEAADVAIGIGDDAAILVPEPDQQLVVSTDTLVSGIHFLPGDEAFGVGHKSLAVSLSDLAAMAAKPKWVTLNLTLPELDLPWIDGFVAGFAALLCEHKVALVGGDTTRGPLSITVTALGQSGQPITRAGAQADELIVISGELGSAAFALHNPGVNADCSSQLHRPKPRLDLVPELINRATAMIDVSDGLLADLGHLCRASGVGAVLEVDRIPHHSVLKQDSNWLHHLLAGGDDYQLCFTWPSKSECRLPAGCVVIGRTTVATDIALRQDGQCIDFKATGYQHFTDASQAQNI